MNVYLSSTSEIIEIHLVILNALIACFIKLTLDKKQLK
jgi:hypothetical protein